MSPEKISAIAAEEMSKLWRAHGILELAVHAIGDEQRVDGKPAIRSALEAATDIVRAAINALEPISDPSDLQLAVRS